MGCSASSDGGSDDASQRRPEPVDPQYLRLRVGPDASTLGRHRKESTKTFYTASTNNSARYAMPAERRSDNSHDDAAPRTTPVAAGRFATPESGSSPDDTPRLNSGLLRMAAQRRGSDGGSWAESPTMVRDQAHRSPRQVDGSGGDAGADDAADDDDEARSLERMGVTRQTSFGRAAAEPGRFARSFDEAMRVAKARLLHGISDDPDQFRDDIDACDQTQRVLAAASVRRTAVAAWLDGVSSAGRDATFDPFLAASPNTMRLCPPDEFAPPMAIDLLDVSLDPLGVSSSPAPDGSRRRSSCMRFGVSPGWSQVDIFAGSSLATLPPQLPCDSGRGSTTSPGLEGPPSQRARASVHGGALPRPGAASATPPPHVPEA